MLWASGPFGLNDRDCLRRWVWFYFQLACLSHHDDAPFYRGVVSDPTFAYFLLKGRRRNPCLSIIVTVSWHRLSIPGEKSDRTFVQGESLPISHIGSAGKLA
jgi:hypothetical protein